MVRRPTPAGDEALALHACLTWLRAATGPWLVADSPAPALGLPASRAVSSGISMAPASRHPATASPAAAALGGTSAKAPATPRDPAAQDALLASMAQEVAACERCTLCAGRTQTVYGVGASIPRLVIVGEAPGAEEDRRGEPFVGPAGQLLDKMLGAIGLDRTQVYICNVLKCRPPGNRDPRPDEVGACRAWLDAQLEALDPEIILALGSPAARALLGTHRGITSLRGRFARSVQGYRVMPSFHPAYLLRNPAAKRDAWEDLQKVAAALELAIPPRRS